MWCLWHAYSSKNLPLQFMQLLHFNSRSSLLLFRYSTRSIISRGLYIFYPIFHVNLAHFHYENKKNAKNLLAWKLDFITFRMFSEKVAAVKIPSILWDWWTVKFKTWIYQNGYLKIGKNVMLVTCIFLKELSTAVLQLLHFNSGSSLLLFR